MKVEQVAIEKVKPYWQNPRKRSAASIRKIADSIAAFGWQQPIVVDKDYVVIIGHGRLEAAKLLEQKRVPVLIAASLSPGKVKALRIADNRVNRESDWDVKALMAEIDGLKNLDVDVSLAGFDDEDLKRLADDIDEQSVSEFL
jgi:ParB-like chromosome segregation protein Spo0J